MSSSAPVSDLFEVELRDFRPEDIVDMVEILAQTWDFGTFANPEGLRACQRQYLLKNAHTATEAIVAVKDGVLLGYLFGRIPGRIFCSQHDFLEEAYAQAQLDWTRFATHEERAQWESDWMWVLKWYEARYAELGATALAASHMDLFMVSQQSRGLGIGTKLFTEFKRRHLAANAGQSILLQTDTWCGWRFYEKNGFKRLFECPASGVPESEEAHQAYFLYGGRF